MTHRLRPEGSFAAASFPRRLAAMLYDFLLCLALMIVVTLIYKLLMMLIIGEARLRALSESGSLDGDPILSTLLVLTLFAFFGKFWTHAGQTLGMQVWGLRVQNADGTAITLKQALIRFLVSVGSWLCFGLGFFWVLIDGEKRSWHDIMSHSQLVKLPPRTKTPPEGSGGAEAQHEKDVSPPGAGAKRRRGRKSRRGG